MSIEYQHVTGGWRITDYDSRTDADPFPDQSTLKGKVTFTASFDEQDRFAAIRVPGDDVDPETYALSVRPMVFPIVAGRLQDRQARDGAWLPAVVAGVPIVWTATPELFEDPGRGTLGPKVRADSVTFGPADPDAAGVRAVNLANIMDAGTEYPAPVISRVAQLVRDAESAATAAAGSAAGVAQSAEAAAASAGEAADSELAAAGSATTALDSEVSARDSADDAASSAADAARSRDAASGAGAARDAAEQSAGLAADSAEAAAGSATAAAGSADLASDAATDAGAAADRAEAAADASEQGAPAGGWTETDLSTSVRTSLARADGALVDAPATVTLTNLAPEVSAAFGQVIDDSIRTKADLGPNGQLITSQIPALAITSRRKVENRAELLGLDAQEGDVGIIQSGDPDQGSYMLGPGDPTDFASWALLVAPEDAVQSVNGQVGPVNLGADDVGAAHATHGHAIGDVDGLQDALAARMPAAVVDALPADPAAGVLYLIPEV
ncbi:hypothetical protein [Rhodococcus sp. 14-2470-1a]|uniref:hypothetical protein n=1 Tax=Rhodococcus sp. 14-2470-1a TaxID=2023150 RepID=UPI000B9A2BBC|nr:hypothetical protein [Rhodococcus sp. 14-2470-1a]OZF41931.1 hypothetical protein CH292_27380 [Rhodococcus sp. 14-2470-1a]